MPGDGLISEISSRMRSMSGNKTVNRVMLAEIAVNDKQDMLRQAHFLDHGQEADIRPPKTGSTADHVNDQVGQQQIVLNHGQVKGIGGIAALTVGHLQVVVQNVGVDFNLDIL